MRGLLLTLLDFLFVLLIICLGIVLVYVFTNEESQQAVLSWVEKVRLESISIDLPAAIPVVTALPDIFNIERKSLVEDLPLPTQPAPPTPTPDPIVYRNEVILRARNFANTLESFFQVNEQVRGSPDLVNDAQWRRETEIRLDQFVTAAWDLGRVSPVPPENAALQGVLDDVGPTAQSMRDNYLEGITTGSREKMKAAGDDLDRIYSIMAQVESEMVKAGWQP